GALATLEQPFGEVGSRVELGGGRIDRADTSDEVAVAVAVALSAAGVSLCSESSREIGRLGGRGGGRWLVVGAVAEHREDDVAAAAGQADHGSIVALALGAFAVVVGLGDRIVVRGDPSRVEQRVLQPLVARSGRELTTDRGTGSSGDRRDPGICGEMARGLEGGAVADVQEDLGGGLGAPP